MAFGEGVGVADGATGRCSRPAVCAGDGDRDRSRTVIRSSARIRDRAAYRTAIDDHNAGAGGLVGGVARGNSLGGRAGGACVEASDREGAWAGAANGAAGRGRGAAVAGYRDRDQGGVVIGEVLADDEGAAVQRVGDCAARRARRSRWRRWRSRPGWPCSRWGPSRWLCRWRRR